MWRVLWRNFVNWLTLSVIWSFQQFAMTVNFYDGELSMIIMNLQWWSFRDNSNSSVTSLKIFFSKIWLPRQSLMNFKKLHFCFSDFYSKHQVKVTTGANTKVSVAKFTSKQTLIKRKTTTELSSPLNKWRWTSVWKISRWALKTTTTIESFVSWWR